MTQRKIEVYTCDRCERTEQFDDRHPSEIYKWGRIHVQQVNGPLRIGGGNEKPKFCELCPACIAQVIRWFDRPLLNVPEIDT